MKRYIIYSLFSIFYLLFFIGCALYRPAPKFVLEGVVKFKGHNLPLADVTLEVKKDTQWGVYKLKKRTNEVGKYKFVLKSLYFGDDYRVKVMFYDEKGNLYVSDWKYGYIRWAKDRVDFEF